MRALARACAVAIQARPATERNLREGILKDVDLRLLLGDQIFNFRKENSRLFTPQMSNFWQTGTKTPPFLEGGDMLYAAAAGPKSHEA